MIYSADLKNAQAIEQHVGPALLLAVNRKLNWASVLKGIPLFVGARIDKISPINISKRVFPHRTPRKCFLFPPGTQDKPVILS